jgi:hypothetical protein
MDEAFAIPTEKAMKIALRTQQIIAEETHVTDVVDPTEGRTTSSRSPASTSAPSSRSSPRSTSSEAR